jgi:hypothetical protein
VQAPADAARNEPTTRRYEIRIKGRVSEETVLHGEITDQAALYGLLDRVADLGLELIEVRRLPEAPVASPPAPHTPTTTTPTPRRNG